MHLLDDNRSGISSDGIPVNRVFQRITRSPDIGYDYALSSVISTIML